MIVSVASAVNLCLVVSISKGIASNNPAYQYIIYMYTPIYLLLSAICISTFVSSLHFHNFLALQVGSFPRFDAPHGPRGTHPLLKHLQTSRSDSPRRWHVRIGPIGTDDLGMSRAWSWYPMVLTFCVIKKMPTPNRKATIRRLYGLDMHLWGDSGGWVNHLWKSDWGRWFWMGAVVV